VGGDDVPAASGVVDAGVVTATADDVAAVDEVEVAEDAEVVVVLVAVDEVAFELTLPVLEEFALDEASELTAARVRGPKNPVAGNPCACWNLMSAA